MSGESLASLLDRAEVRKAPYSAGKWRVFVDNQELWLPTTFDHPHLGPIRINGPVCAETKRDCTAMLAALRSQHGSAA